jgi:HPt (histidine-containing phosphotransfer) domain-containing protein
MQDPVDPTLIYSSLASDPDFADLVEMYVDDVPDLIQQLNAAADLSSWTELAGVAHQIKGSAGGHGFEQVTDAARQLEEACTEEGLPSEILQRLGELVNLLGRLRVAPES